MPYGAEITAAAQRHGLDPALLAGLVRQESNFDPTAGSPAGARGLTQLMPATAASLGVTDVTDPAQALEGGAKYLKQQLDAFGGDVTKALAAYNAGPGAVQRYGGVPPYAETQTYVQKVQAFAAALPRHAVAAARRRAASERAPLLDRLRTDEPRPHRSTTAAPEPRPARRRARARAGRRLRRAARRARRGDDAVAAPRPARAARRRPRPRARAACRRRAPRRPRRRRRAAPDAAAQPDAAGRSAVAAPSPLDRRARPGARRRCSGDRPRRRRAGAVPGCRGDCPRRIRRPSARPAAIATVDRPRRRRAGRRRRRRRRPGRRPPPSPQPGAEPASLDLPAPPAPAATAPADHAAEPRRAARAPTPAPARTPARPATASRPPHATARPPPRRPPRPRRARPHRRPPRRRAAARRRGRPAAPPVAAAPPAPAAPLAQPQHAVPLHQAPRAVAQVLHLAVERERAGEARVSHARLNLRPVELGGIEIRLQSSAAGVTAQVVADSPEAARLLQQAADDLRRSLERQDVTLLSLDVSTAGDDRAGGSAGAGRDGLRRPRRAPDRPARRRPRRRGEADEPAVAETVTLPGGLHVDVLA